MGDKSAIEWTDATWNPVRGCSIVSKGCTNCYAMRQAHRSSGAGGAYEGLTKLTKGGPVWTGEIRLVPELLEQPLRWSRPRRIFVNSMSDLFHEDVSEEFIDKVFAVMCRAHDHTFQVLTKRADRMAAYLSSPDRRAKIFLAGHQVPLCGREVPPQWPLPNVWPGISAEDQERFDERWGYLCGEKFAGWKFWLSAEPLLGPIDARAAMPNKLWAGLEGWQGGELRWIVAGGESGPGARPMHPDWARSLRDQCAAAGVAFFFKQWGNWVQCETEVHADERGREVYPIDESLIEKMGDRGWKVIEAHGAEFVNLGKKLSGRQLDGRTHDEYPDVASSL